MDSKKALVVISFGSTFAKPEPTISAAFSRPWPTPFPPMTSTLQLPP